MNLPWRIELFGGLRARQGDRLIARFASQKSGALLAYLSFYQKRSHSREELAELLWPEAPPEVGRHNLRQALLSVRRQLEPPDAAEVASPLFLASRAEVQLSPTVATDVAEFEARLKSAAQAADSLERAERLAVAIELYQGPLLPGYYEDWVSGERERLADGCLNALRQLVHHLQGAGDLDRAVAYSRRAVVLDPLREEAHGDLIRLLVAADRPMDALRQYEELERIFREQLDEAPSDELQALAQELRRGWEGRGAPTRAGEGATGRAGDPATATRGLDYLAPSPPRPLAPSPERPSPPPLTPRLPVPVTRFFGREEELQRVDLLLRDPTTHLITLTGPGGSGKTRLAIETARRAAGAFDGAVWFVPLADRPDARSLPEAIAEALQLYGSDHTPPLERVTVFLSRRAEVAPTLLILDNFEHLIEEGAILVAELIERVPALTCLVTSRQRLEVLGEHEFAVLPLPVPGVQAFRRSGVQEEPDLGARTPERVNALLQYASVQLFTDRARSTRPDFQVTPRNAAAVAMLCERLEGIPLALELAAARAQMLTPSQMLMQLEARFDFLVSRRRDIAPRHRTLRAAFDWSFELLSPELRRFFARLSVFQGHFTLESAEAVCGDPGLSPDPNPIQNPKSKIQNEPVLDYLTELRERSLVLVTGDEEEEMGYRMLETLREYAAEQLESEDRAVLRRRHAGYYLALAEEAAGHLHGPDQSVWLDRLEAEHDNFRAVLAWSLEQESGVQAFRRSGVQGEPADVALPERLNAERLNTGSVATLGLRLAGRLYFFWSVRGHIAEGRRWLGELLASPAGRGPTAARAMALSGAAGLASAQGDHGAACALHEETLTIRRTLGDPAGIADTLCQWGYAAERIGDRPKARALFSESLQICRETDNRGCLAHVLKCIGGDALAQRDLERARALFEESLAVYRELGDLRGVTMMLGEMAYLALSQAEDERATTLLHEQVELSRRLKDPAHTAMALQHLGHVARHRGDLRTARAFFEESLAMRRQLGGKPEAAELLAYLSSIAWREGDPAEARVLLVESLTLLREVDDRRVIGACLDLLAELSVASVLSPSTALRAARLLAAAEEFRGTGVTPLWWPAEQAARERCVAAVRATLDEPALTAACAEGSAMTLDQAVSEARRIEL